MLSALLVRTRRRGWAVCSRGPGRWICPSGCRLGYCPCDIPQEAYEYEVNGKPAVEWIMDRYQVKTDKASGIVNDPNTWSDDPRYIVDLLARIVRVSVETMNIVRALPSLGDLAAASPRLM